MRNPTQPSIARSLVVLQGPSLGFVPLPNLHNEKPRNRRLGRALRNPTQPSIARSLVVLQGPSLGCVPLPNLQRPSCVSQPAPNPPALWLQPCFVPPALGLKPLPRPSVLWSITSRPSDPFPPPPTALPWCFSMAWGRVLLPLNGLRFTLLFQRNTGFLYRNLWAGEPRPIPAIAIPWGIMGGKCSKSWKPSCRNPPGSWPRP